jgi:hypothetical protein
MGLWWVALASAQTLTVQPFLQSADADGAWVVWEAEGAEQATLRWGRAATALTEEAAATARLVEGGSRIFEAPITGVAQGERVYYAVEAGGARSETHDWVVPLAPAEMGDFRLLAMSDMQRNGLWPDKFREVVHDGVLAWLEAQGNTDLATSFGMILIPGDLVDDGPDHEQWRDAFFAPLYPLSAHVPIWPVYGNHEDGTHWFTDYFHLPDNGDATWTEHWWSKRQGNVVVVGLDSNAYSVWADQMAFLQAELDAACTDDGVDFVIAQLHHPFQSELWVPGNSPLTGQLVQRMEAFSADCGKPSVHLFGHTHAYSRGQTQDHAHLMVNVATAGGAIDRWGEQTQQDYAAFSVSDDDWGFVVVDVTRGPNPTLTVRRLSRGDAFTPRDNVLTDAITLRRYNASPRTPVLVAPADPVVGDCLVVGVANFDDPDGDAHQAAQWQLSRDCEAWDVPARDVWRQDRNAYFGVDLQAEDDLLDEAFEDVAAGAWCARVRLRDAALAWSAWSTPVAFDVSEPARSANLLPDPSAERALEGWVRQGHVEITGDGRCGAALPADGARALALGGPCVAQDGGTVSVRFGLDAVAERVQAGQPMRWSVQAMQGRAALAWTFYDAAGAVIGEARDEVGGDVVWTRYGGARALDAATAAVELVVTAVDGDAVQLDAFEVRVGAEAAACAEPAWPEDRVPAGPDTSCGCAAGGVGANAWATVAAALGLLLRRRWGPR